MSNKLMGQTTNSHKSYMESAAGWEEEGNHGSGISWDWEQETPTRANGTPRKGQWADLEKQL